MLNRAKKKKIQGMVARAVGYFCGLGYSTVFSLIPIHLLLRSVSV